MFRCARALMPSRSLSGAVVVFIVTAGLVVAPVTAGPIGSVALASAAGSGASDDVAEVPSQPLGSLGASNDPAADVDALTPELRELPGAADDAAVSLDSDWAGVPGLPIEVRAVDSAGAPTSEPSASPSAVPSGAADSNAVGSAAVVPMSYGVDDRSMRGVARTANSAVELSISDTVSSEEPSPSVAPSQPETSEPSATPGPAPSGSASPDAPGASGESGAAGDLFVDVMQVPGLSRQRPLFFSLTTVNPGPPAAPQSPSPSASADAPGAPTIEPSASSGPLPSSRRQRVAQAADGLFQFMTSVFSHEGDGGVLAATTDGRGGVAAGGTVMTVAVSTASRAGETSPSAQPSEESAPGSVPTATATEAPEGEGAPEGSAGAAPEVPEGATEGVVEEPVEVRLTYGAFDEAYGGGWSERLQVTAYPACFATDPTNELCSTGVPVEFVNDTATQQVTFTTVDESAFADLDSEFSTDADAADTVTGPDANPGSAEPDPGTNEGGDAGSTSEGGSANGVAGSSSDIGAVAPAVYRSDASSSVQTVATGSSSTGAVYSVGGSGGNYAATPTAPSSGWQVGAGSGEFSWSYPFKLPAALGGATPGLGLNYSSGSVDGMTLAENGQADPAGLGWGLTSSYVMRQYGSCKDDGHSTKGDLCWITDGSKGVVDDLTIVLNGKSSPLVRIGSKDSFRLKQDPTWTVDLLKGADGFANGDNNQESFRVTTTDGTRYWFGRSSDSTLTVPVYGNTAGEQCYGAAGDTAASRWCQQGYKWMLTRVLDTNGNETLYSYDKQQNHYARWGNTSSTVSYDRAAMLSKIEYGFARTTTNPVPRQIVQVATGTRCTKDIDQNDSGATCAAADTPTAKPNLWPDVPADLICNASETCLVGSPTFFSTKRYSQVITKTNAGTGSNQLTRIVDTYDLGYTMPDPDGTGPDQPDLWLSSVQRTGGGANPTSEQAIRFFGTTPLQNRVVVNTGERTMKKYRLAAIRNEAGGWIDVEYGHDGGHNCDPTYVNAQSRWTSERECFPQKYAPPGGTPRWEWWHKYVVTRVALGDNALGFRYQDNTSRATALGALRVYDYEYRGDPAWRYVESRTIPDDERTWSDWRGYAETVISTRATNDNDYQVGTNTLSRTRVVQYRGMDGTLRNPTGGMWDKRVDTNEITDNTTEQQDKPWFEGLTAETELLDSPTTWLNRTFYNYGQIPTAADANGALARGVYEAIRRTRTTTSGATHLSETLTTANTGNNTDNLNLGVGVGTITDVETRSWVNNQPYEYRTCTKTGWNNNNETDWLRVPETVQTYTGGCATTMDPTKMVSSTKHWYDNTEDSTAATVNKGNLTQTKQFLGSAATADFMATKWSYDQLGRVTSERAGITKNDGLGGTTGTHSQKSTTTYNPAGTWDDLLTSIRTTSPNPTPGATVDGFATVTELDARRGQPTKITDPNEQRIDLSYDALGRLSTVTLPNNDGANGPSMRYDYRDSITQPGRVKTTIRRDPSTTDVSYVFYDGWGRQIETQTKQPDVTGYARIVTMTGYDAQGLVAYSAPGFPAATSTDPEVINADPATLPNWTRTSYDPASRPVSVVKKGLVKPDTTSPAVLTTLRTTTTAYTGDTITVTPPTGLGKTTTTLDTRGNTAKVELRDAAGATVLDSASYSYDTLNQLTALTKTYTGSGLAVANQTQTWSWNYDWLGRETKSVDPDTGITDTAYLGDDATTITRTAHGAPAEVLAKTRTDYDGLGRPTARYSLKDTSTANVNSQIANWTYDTASLGKGYLAEASSKTDLGVFTDAVTAYDKLGNPTVLTSAYPANLTGQNGTRTSGPWASGTNDQATVAIEQFYNLAGDPTTTMHQGITTAGNPGANGVVKMPATEITRSYTDDSHISSIVATLRDFSNQPQTIDIGRWTYNNTARPRTITSKTQGTTSNPTLERTYTWNDANGWLDQIRAKNPDNTNPYLKLDYTRDTTTSQIRRIDRTSTTTATSPAVSEVSCYTYDALTRLTRATDTINNDTDHCEPNRGIGGGGTTANYDHAYTYTQDRLATVTTGAASTQTTSTYGYVKDPLGTTPVVPLHQLTSADTTSATSPIPTTDANALPIPMTQNWDGLGRVSTTTTPSAGGKSRTSTNTYDALGNLTATTENDSTKNTRITTNAFDTDGIRRARKVVTDPDNTTNKTTTTVVYLANGLELEATHTGTGSPTLAKVRHTYTGPDGNPLATQDGDTFTWLVGDHLNTTRATLTNNAAATVKHHNYGPYGQPAPIVLPGTPGERGYLNKPHDPNGDIRLDHRTYNPAVGVFTTPDPVLITTDPLNLNPYTYARHNPINGSDPTGLCMGEACPATEYPDTKTGNGAGHSSPGLGSTVSDTFNTLTSVLGPSSDGSTEAPSNEGGGIAHFFNGPLRLASSWYDHTSSGLQCMAALGSSPSCRVQQESMQDMRDSALDSTLYLPVPPAAAGAGRLGGFLKGVANGLRLSGGAAVTRAPQVLRVGDLKLSAVPRGAVGTRTTTGKGLEYAIPRGTAELSERVASVRIMDPVTTGKYVYPNGYAVYMNVQGQRVNPLTGQMIHDLSNPFAHIPLR